MSSHLEFVHVTAASMESINSDINKSPPPPEDYALSDGEIAEDDHGTNESTPTAVNTSSAMSSSGDGLPKLPDGANTGTLASILSSILSRNSAEGVSETSCWHQTFCGISIQCLMHRQSKLDGDLDGWVIMNSDAHCLVLTFATQFSRPSNVADLLMSSFLFRSREPGGRILSPCFDMQLKGPTANAKSNT